jgi:hypothetical protein
MFYVWDLPTSSTQQHPSCTGAQGHSAHSAYENRPSGQLMPQPNWQPHTHCRLGQRAQLPHKITSTWSLLVPSRIQRSIVTNVYYDFMWCAYIYIFCRRSSFPSLDKISWKLTRKSLPETPELWGWNLVRWRWKYFQGDPPTPSISTFLNLPFTLKTTSCRF